MALTKASLLRAVVYADIFDFPLNKEELYHFSVEEKASTKQQFEGVLESLRMSVKEEHGYFFLNGRGKIVQIRRRRQGSSKKKLDLARILSVYMSFIPTVLFVGVTGGVAADNAEENDDIDFLIITSKNALWPTRIVLLIMLQLLGRRRTRNATVVSDMACLNLFLDESGMQLSESMRSLYTAHEIVQMRPLFSRGGMYERFLEKNSWIFTFLPQSKERMSVYEYTKKAVKPSLLSRFFVKNAVVQLSKFLQRVYMGKKNKDSYISATMIGFYPQEFHENLLKMYEMQSAKYLK